GRIGRFAASLSFVVINKNGLVRPRWRACHTTVSEGGREPIASSKILAIARFGRIDRGCVGPERSSGRCAVDLSGRKTWNRTSIVLPRWFVDDGPTGWIA